MSESALTFRELTTRYHNYCVAKANAHYHVSERLHVLHRRVGTVATGLTALVGSAVFASLSKVGDDIRVKVGTGVLSVAAVVATALQSFLALATEAERYRSVGGKYGAIRRSIELLVLKYPNANGAPDEPATVGLEKIKGEMDELA
jgi:hypothetical protein